MPTAHTATPYPRAVPARAVVTTLCFTFGLTASTSCGPPGLPGDDKSAAARIAVEDLCRLGIPLEGTVEELTTHRAAIDDALRRAVGTSRHLDGPDHSILLIGNVLPATIDQAVLGLEHPGLSREGETTTDPRFAPGPIQPYDSLAEARTALSRACAAR